MTKNVRVFLTDQPVTKLLGLSIALLIVAVALPAGAQVPAPGDCGSTVLPAVDSSPTIAKMVIPLLEEPAYTSTGPGDDVNAQYCYWRELVTCKSCVYHFSCWLWYGSANQYGKECVGRRVEYCDGHPTGIEYPVLELQCGCTP